MSRLLNVSMSRRELVRAGVSGTLVLALPLTGCSESTSEAASSGAADANPGTAENLNAFVSMGADGFVTIYLPNIEMGQGTYTTLPALVAEEMDLPMDRVRAAQAPPGPDYRLMPGGMRFTGDSRSIRAAYVPMREAGAAARVMLMAAAAQRWGVPATEMKTAEGRVLHETSGRQADYADLAADAARLEPPEEVRLKPEAEFRLLGRSLDRTDVAVKTRGEPAFGIDTAPPGVLAAAIRQAPAWGGQVEAFDEAAARATPGVVAVENLGASLVVLGETWWHARKGLDAASPQFTAGAASGFSTEAHAERLRAALAERGITAEAEGQDPDTVPTDSGLRVEADYLAPFLAHATMEPQNCTALVTDSTCTVWAPNQGVEVVVDVARRITGLPESAITVHTPYLGGGFGRRYLVDFAEQAIETARRHKGQPVKLTWSREEDIRHDHYRPMAAARFHASLGDDGLPIALRAAVAGDGPFNRILPQVVEQAGFDPSVVEGVTGASYAIPNRRVDYIYVETPPPIGPWRSVANSHNGFFKESFIDELAHAASEDPYAYRRRLLAGAPRVLAVLDAAAAMAGWDENGALNRETGHARGIAVHEAFGSIIAQVAEVSVESGQVRVHRVWCAVDCGLALDPRIVTMQMESGIAMGLSAALHEEVRMSEGRATQSNFHDYPILTAQEMPDIEVRIVESGEPVGGIGEVGLPPVAPAVCNALFALTGQRIRDLPIPVLA